MESCPPLYEQPSLVDSVDSLNALSNDNSSSSENPFDRMRAVAGALAEAVESVNWPETRRLADELYLFRQKLGPQLLIRDGERGPLTAGLIVTGALTSDRVDAIPSVQLPLARAARLFLDAALRQVIIEEESQVSEKKELFGGLKAKIKGWSSSPKLGEDLAGELTKKLRGRRNVLTKVEDHLLRFEVDCCYQALKALPTVHKELAKTYCDTLAKALINLGLEGAIDLFWLADELRHLKVSQSVTDVLFVQWAGRYAALKLGGDFDQVHEFIQNKKGSANVALAGIEFYADVIWRGAQDPYKKQALTELATLARTVSGPKGGITYCAIQHIGTLVNSYPETTVRMWASELIEELKGMTLTPLIQELLSAPHPVWNHVLRIPITPIEHQEQSHRRYIEQKLIEMRWKSRFDDPSLSSYVKKNKDNPNFKTLCLRRFGAPSTDALEEAFRVAQGWDRLDLQGCPYIDIDRFTAMQIGPTRLKYLNLAKHPLSDEQLRKVLVKCRFVQELNLEGCPNLSGRYLDQFSGRSLVLRDINLTNDQDLAQLLIKGDLRHLDLGGVKRITPSIFDHGGWLESLYLRGIHLKMGGLNGCSRLQVLDFSNSVIDSWHGFPPHLTNLNLSGARGVLPKLLDQLNPDLIELHLDRQHSWTDENLRPLFTRFQKLQVLSLIDTGITGAAIDASFPGLPELTELRIGFNPVGTIDQSSPSIQDYANIASWPNWSRLLEKFPKLTKLYLSSAAVAPPQVVELVKAVPNLEILTLTALPSHHAEILMALFQSCPCFTELRLPEGSAQGLRGLKLAGSLVEDRHVPMIAKLFPQLMAIDFSDCSRITGRGLKEVIRLCTSLISISIGGCANILGSGGVLDLAGIPDRPLSLIQGIVMARKSVMRLNLSGCALSDEAIGKLVDKCRDLVYLDLSNCDQIGDSTTQAIGKLRSLQTLRMAHCGELSHSKLEDLSRAEQLASLNLEGCVPNIACNSLRFDNRTTLSDKILETLVCQAPHLQQLSLEGCYRLSVQGIKSALAHCPQLHELSCLGCHQVQAADLGGFFAASPMLSCIHHGGRVIQREDTGRPKSPDSAQSAEGQARGLFVAAVNLSNDRDFKRADERGWIEAIATMRQAVKLSSSPGLAVQAYMKIALWSLQLKHLDAVLEACDQGFPKAQLDTERARFLNIKALAKRQQGDLKAAEELARAGLRLVRGKDKISNIRLLTTQGLTYLKQERYAKSLKNFTKALDYLASFRADMDLQSHVFSFVEDIPLVKGEARGDLRLPGTAANIRAVTLLERSICQILIPDFRAAVHDIDEAARNPALQDKDWKEFISVLRKKLLDEQKLYSGAKTQLEITKYTLSPLEVALLINDVMSGGGRFGYHEGWKRLDNSIANFNSYMGRTYHHEQKQELVVVHSLPRLEGRRHHEIVEGINGAVESALRYMREVMQKQPDDVLRLVNVGFHAGGALAELVAYQTKQEAISIDSPGSATLIASFPKSSSSASPDEKCERITEYLTAPGPHNVMDRHIGGHLIRIFPESGQTSGVMWSVMSMVRKLWPSHREEKAPNIQAILHFFARPVRDRIAKEVVSWPTAESLPLYDQHESLFVPEAGLSTPEQQRDEHMNRCAEAKYKTIDLQNEVDLDRLPSDGKQAIVDWHTPDCSGYHNASLSPIPAEVLRATRLVKEKSRVRLSGSGPHEFVPLVDKFTRRTRPRRSSSPTIPSPISSPARDRAQSSPPGFAKRRRDLTQSDR